MQLDLFDQPQHQAEMLAFPPGRMTATIRAAAARVASAGQRAQRALDREVGLLQIRYWKIGLPEHQALRLADKYEQAIVAELQKAKFSNNLSDPKGPPNASSK